MGELRTKDTWCSRSYKRVWHGDQKKQQGSRGDRASLGSIRSHSKDSGCE